MTIEQIQSLITDKGDLREIVNELADYIQSNPSSPGGSGYLVYMALLSQSGTDAPVATVCVNQLGGVVVWSRDVTGSYIATLAGAFTVGKTTIIASQWTNSAEGLVKTFPVDSNTVGVETFLTIDGQRYDNELNVTSVIIFVGL